MQIIFIIYLFLFLIIYLSPIIIVIDCNYVFLQIFQTFLFTNNKSRKKKILWSKNIFHFLNIYWAMFRNSLTKNPVTCKKSKFQPKSKKKKKKDKKRKKKRLI